MTVEVEYSSVLLPKMQVWELVRIRDTGTLCMAIMTAIPILSFIDIHMDRHDTLYRKLKVSDLTTNVLLRDMSTMLMQCLQIGDSFGILHSICNFIASSGQNVPKTSSNQCGGPNSSQNGEQMQETRRTIHVLRLFNKKAALFQVLQ